MITSCNCFNELCKQQGEDVTYDIEFAGKKHVIEQQGLGKYDISMFRPEDGICGLSGWYRGWFGITYCPFCGKKIEVEE